jgi:hypothetical protein
VNLQGEDALYSDNSYYLKGADLKHFFAGNEGFSYKYVKDDECFLKPLTSDKQSELDKLVSSHNLTCMSVEAFFMKKTG